MIHTIAFTKMSGAGNDFVLLDAMTGALPSDMPHLAVALCSRHFGVGADGLLILEPSRTADFFMRYFNADGSYGGMCGNGGRCAARYASLHEIARDRMKFEALGFVYEAFVCGATVKLSMKPPEQIMMNMVVALGSETLSCNFINTGSPHAVIFVDDLPAQDVERKGRALRVHPLFAPEGTNVDFVSTGPGNVIDVRTYERGVERETLACGTGSVASAIITYLERSIRPPVRVHVMSGEELTVHFLAERDRISDVVLEGSAHLVFTGTARYDDARGTLVDHADQPLPATT